jgi:hypothetical protein
MEHKREREYMEGKLRELKNELRKHEEMQRVDDTIGSLIQFIHLTHCLFQRCSNCSCGSNKAIGDIARTNNDNNNKRPIIATIVATEE